MLMVKGLYMPEKSKTKERICVFAQNKQFFDYISHVLKTANYQFVNSAQTDCSEKKNRCDIKIVAVETPDKEQPVDDSHCLPLVMIEGSGDINTFVESVKVGEFDFIEQTHDNKNTRDIDGYESLTRSEKIILQEIMDGNSNRIIADKLHRSIRTIEDHRLHIMRKLHAESLVDLIKKCISEK